MRNGTRVFGIAVLSGLLLAGRPSASGIEPAVPSAALAVDLSSPAAGEFLLSLLGSDLDVGPSSSSIPSSEAFLSWVKGGGALPWAAPSGLDGPPTVLQGIVCNDLVTGGGSISVGSSNGTFGFFAGIKDGLIFVGCEYVDHDTDFQVKMLSISAYELGAAAECRHFEGQAAIDGVAGFGYSVDVCDNAEPGTGVDTFNISLSNGYSAGGVLQGGNVQHHVDCP